MKWQQEDSDSGMFQLPRQDWDVLSTVPMHPTDARDSSLPVDPALPSAPSLPARPVWPVPPTRPVDPVLPVRPVLPSLPMRAGRGT